MKAISFMPAGAALNLRTLKALKAAFVNNATAVVVICGMVSFFSLLFGATVTGFLTGLACLLSIEAASHQKGGEA